jgi:hypothetical protein
MAGKHRAKKRQPEAYVWLGTGAMTLGLGVALAAGSGVAQADTTNASVGGVTPSPGSSAATTSIRTTISAQSVNTSTNSSTPVVAGEENATSIVTTNDSVVRQMDPADTGDNDAGGDSTLAGDLLGLNNTDSGILGVDAGPSIPFIELGGGGGGLLSRIAGALGVF